MSPVVAPIRTPAVRIGDAEQAIRIAEGLATRLAAGAAERDAQRRPPVDEVAEVAASGLLGIAVNRRDGGPEVGIPAVAEVYRLLAVGDPNVAQIIQSHTVFVHHISTQGGDDQRHLLLGEVLGGALLANAQAEADAPTPADIRTAVRRTPAGGWVLDGTKHYATGTLFADRIPVTALSPDGGRVVAYVPAGQPGVEVIDDWAGMGQRTTASGTVRLRAVEVDGRWVIPLDPAFDGPGIQGALAQLLHTAIDVGIARAALIDGIELLRRSSRPWHEAGVERAADDPLTLQRVGELEVQARAAEALLRHAAEQVEEGRRSSTESAAAAASWAVAAAKVAAGRAAVDVASAVFEIGGTRTAADGLNLHRHWRNARTHTLHDPARWKLQHLGRNLVHGTPPPRHSAF